MYKQLPIGPNCVFQGICILTTLRSPPSLLAYVSSFTSIPKHIVVQR